MKTGFRSDVIMTNWRRCRCGFVLSLLLATLTRVTLAAAAAPPWLGNELGRGGGLLPGFEPVAVREGQISLGGPREYDWSGTTLPVAISSRGMVLVDRMQLVARITGRETVISVPMTLRSSAPDHVDLSGSASVSGGAMFSIRIRVDYDGLAMTDVVVSGQTGSVLQSLEVRFSLPVNEDLQVMAFDPATMYNYRPFFIGSCYEGPYRSVLGFNYANASFWWFADELDRDSLGEKPETRLGCANGKVQVRQPLLATARKIGAGLPFRFGFLATPVRNLDGSFRHDRYTSSASPAEGNRGLWWIDATAHYALPYVDLPPGVRRHLPAGDLSAYPGPDRNRAQVVKLRGQGFERLPYISLRSLSFLDPVIGIYEPEWEVLPRIETTAASDAPYKAGHARSILSHRGPGFSDYLLWRLHDVADRLNVRGFYFDQGSPAGSQNPAQLWPGAAKGSAATDILAMREFFRRLATMLNENGMAPLIYVHNSSAPVIPAFTFVTAMVQGEEAIPAIRNLDYQGSFDIDRVRANFAPGAWGIPTVWLEEIWSAELASQRPLRYRWADEATWLASDEYRQRWRGFMALALLHDIPVWSLAPLHDRQAVYEPLDRFGVVKARFIGYWNLTGGWRDRKVLVSGWVRQMDNKAMLIVANRGDELVEVNRAELAGMLNPKALHLRGNAGAGKRWTIPAHDFVLVEVETTAA